MKALTSSDIKLWQSHRAHARKCFDDVAKAVDAANTAVETFNAVVQQACQLATTWADAAEEYYQERSERWQEDEAGQAYQAWSSELRDLAVRVEQLDEIEAPDEPDWLQEDPQEQP